MNILWDKPDLNISCYENVLPPELFQRVLLYSQDISRYKFRYSYLQEEPIDDDGWIIYDLLIQHHKETFPFLKDCKPQVSNFLRYQVGHHMHPHNDMGGRGKEETDGRFNVRKFTTCLYLTSNKNNPLRFVNINNLYEQVFNYYNVEFDCNKPIGAKRKSLNSAECKNI